MKQGLLKSSLLTLILSSSVSLAGVFNGGGGYGLICQDNKYFALDYMVTNSEASVSPRLVGLDEMQILNKIQAALEKRIPQMGQSLKKFMLFNRNRLNGSTDEVWMDGEHLMSLEDHPKLRLPKRCVTEDGRLKVIPAIVRIQNENGTRFYVDTEVMNKLRETGSVQVTFAYIHEWLRAYTDDAQVISEVNSILHSEEFFTHNEFELVGALERHGLRGLERFIYEPPRLSPDDRIVFSWDGVVAPNSDPGKYWIDVIACHEIDRYRTQCEPVAKSHEVTIGKGPVDAPKPWVYEWNVFKYNQDPSWWYSVDFIKDGRPHAKSLSALVGASFIQQRIHVRARFDQNPVFRACDLRNRSDCAANTSLKIRHILGELPKVD